jgi:hypothetical protein
LNGLLNILIQAYLNLLRFANIAFFTIGRFVATLHGGSLSVPFFQQHMLALCVPRFGNSCNISNFVVYVMVICSQLVS